MVAIAKQAASTYYASLGMRHSNDEIIIAPQGSLEVCQASIDFEYRFVIATASATSTENRMATCSKK